MIRIEKKVVAAALIAAGVVLSTVALVSASSKAQLSKKLAATAGAPVKAAGKANLNLHFVRHKGTRGNFTVAANHLAGLSSYDVIVGGVKVGTITTNRGGNGRAAFSTTPRGKTSLLGFDPRGSTVVLRDSSGTDVLVGTVPDDTPGSQACCVTDTEGETECEDMLASDCTTAGGTTPMVTNPDGTQTPATSCLPDPCNPGATPPGNVAIACCINSTHDEGTESQCEDYTEAECATAGGTVVQVPGATPGDGNPCDLNPCQPASPPSTPPTVCCVPQATASGETEAPECEDLTPDACSAAGGSAPANGATTCDPNPCV